jgi:hypothetical protein
VITPSIAPALSRAVPADGSSVASVSSIELVANEEVSWSNIVVHEPHANASLAGATGQTIVRPFATDAPGTYEVTATLTAGGRTASAKVTFVVKTARGAATPAPASKLANASGSGSITLSKFPLRLKGGSKLVSVKLSWPSRSITQQSVVSLTPASTAGSSSIHVTVIGASDGESLTHFAEPLQLVFSNVPDGLIPLFSASGGGWKKIPALASGKTTLKAGESYGYARRGPTITVYTRSLGFFRLAA